MPPQEFDDIDDLFLADLFSYNESYLDFFQQESIQKIIDRQFEYTKKFISRLLLIYCVGFVVPQITNIYINGLRREMKLPDNFVILQMILYVMCGTTQFFFYTLEYAEMQYSGIGNYF